MDKIQFKLGEYLADNHYLIRYVDVYINEICLIDLVCQAINAHYKRQGNSDFCGYVGLHIVDEMFHGVSFPGISPDPMSRSEYWGTVLTCTCGEDLCASISARVEIMGDFILWHEVLDPWLAPLPAGLVDDKEYEFYVPCNFSGIGPYVFRRNQYIDAWNNFKEWVMKWKRLYKLSV